MTDELLAAPCEMCGAGTNGGACPSSSTNVGAGSWVWEDGAMKMRLVLVAAIGMLIVGCGDTKGSKESSGPAADAASENSDLQRCVDSWNAAARSGQGSNANFGKLWLGPTEKYAAVGFSADFPDRCLVTLADPDLDGAAQFQESGEGGWLMTGDTATPSDIPESAKRWNATRAGEGSLSLGAP